MNIKFQTKPGYAEESQPNPMRWLLLSKTKDGFQQESDWLRCKDFFNDYAYTVQTGKKFTIYGFNAGNMNPPKKGEPVYMLLDVLTPQFLANMSIMNPWLASQGMPIVSYQPLDGKVLVEFHPKYFENTYYISLVSLIIRLMNLEYEFKDFQEVIGYKKFATKDQLKWDQVVSKGNYFTIPENLKKYIWYCGKEHNSDTVKEGYNIPSLVHNCGVLTWQAYF